MPHVVGRRLLEGRDAIVGIAAVLDLIDFGLERRANGRIGQLVVFADAKVEQFAIRIIGERLPLGPLDLLELVDVAAFAVGRADDALADLLDESAYKSLPDYPGEPPSLDDVRAALSGIKELMTADFVSERNERF